MTAFAVAAGPFDRDRTKTRLEGAPVVGREAAEGLAAEPGTPEAWNRPWLVRRVRSFGGAIPSRLEQLGLQDAPGFGPLPTTRR